MFNAKKLIICIKDFPYKIINLINMKRKHVCYNKDIQIHGKIGFHGDGNIIFGHNVVLTSSVSYNPSSGDCKTTLSSYGNAVIEIGDNTGISNSAITAQNKVTIGKNVLIGSGCMITDTDFHSTRIDFRMQSPDVDVKTAPIIISDGAFIGARSIVLKGVTIGENSVVGAGSVVTKDIPPNEIWAGNPVKFVKNIY